MGPVCSLLRYVASEDGKARVALASYVLGAYRFRDLASAPSVASHTSPNPALGRKPVLCPARWPQGSPLCTEVPRDTHSLLSQTVRSFGHWLPNFVVLAPLQALEPLKTWAQDTQPTLAWVRSEFRGWELAWVQKPSPERALMTRVGSGGAYSPGKSRKEEAL